MIQIGHTKPILLKGGGPAGKRVKSKVLTTPPFKPEYTRKKESTKAGKQGTSFCPEV
jgi:hypothetical protein